MLEAKTVASTGEACATVAVLTAQWVAKSVDSTVFKGRAVVVGVTTVLGVTKTVESTVGPTRAVIVSRAFSRRITKAIGTTDRARIWAIKVCEALLFVVAKAVCSAVLAEETIEITLASICIVAKTIRRAERLPRTVKVVCTLYIR